MQGIEMRPDEAGRIRYRVRVRRRGQTFAATLPTLEEALAFRAQALAAAEGKAEPPTAPRTAAAPAPPGRQRRLPAAR